MKLNKMKNGKHLAEEFKVGTRYAKYKNNKNNLFYHYFTVLYKM